MSHFPVYPHGEFRASHNQDDKGCFGPPCHHHTRASILLEETPNRQPELVESGHFLETSHSCGSVPTPSLIGCVISSLARSFLNFKCEYSDHEDQPRHQDLGGGGVCCSLDV